MKGHATAKWRRSAHATGAHTAATQRRAAHGRAAQLPWRWPPMMTTETAHVQPPRWAVLQMPRMPRMLRKLLMLRVLHVVGGGV